MSIDTINHNGNSFYRLQAEGFASKFAFSFAKELCKGEGLDIGCHKKEWALPGATPIDKLFLQPLLKYFIISSLELIFI